MFRFLGVAALVIASVATQQGAHGQICDPSQPGCITEFAVPSDQAGNTSQPRGITRGPDGAIWFTEGPNPANGNKIARIPTSATSANPQIVEFLIPTPNSLPNSITTGADGALWFTEFDGRKIGRIPLSASPASPGITESSPTLSQPAYITLGPDGALWFTEYSNDNIGRVASDGTFTEIPLPAGSGSPYAITVGPDGALWFTEYNTAKIGRIPVSATPDAPGITEFPISSGPVALSGITTGPDGALWFTETVENKIGLLFGVQN
jgi:virginiamycin B lyase